MEIFSQLGVDWYKLGIQAFNFVLLIVLLRALAYKPLLRMLDERRARIRSDLDEARRLREESERDRAEYQAQLAKARDDARGILEEANGVAARIREQAQAEAAAQTAAQLQRAREEIAREKEQAIGELRREVADLAIMAASHVVGRSLDGADQRRLVDQALERVGPAEVR